MNREDVAVNIGAVLIDQFNEMDLISEEESERAKESIYQEYLEAKGIKKEEVLE